MENHPDCELFFAPSDVQLGNNKRTVVQPDLFVFCGREIQQIDMLREAPDFIIEVVSPSNPEHDKFRKLNKYRFAGVREYWIVDPQTRKVTVYHLEQDLEPEVYGFTDSIPVGISEGSCRIDFADITKRVKKYFRQ
jgi:Uma2 family endonuclease